MNKTIALAMIGALSLAGIAAPALAGTESGTVPYCSAGNNEDAIKQQEWALSTQLQLDSKQSGHIEVWNGCFKVMVTEGGVTTVSFYDPNSLRLIDRLN